MGFSIRKVHEASDDICEQCKSEENPVYHLKGKYDNVDAILCGKCLDDLKRAINAFSMEAK